MPKADSTCDLRHLASCLPVSQVRLRVKNLKNTLCSCNIRHKLIIEITEVHDRSPEH